MNRSFSSCCHRFWSHLGACANGTVLNQKTSMVQVQQHLMMTSHHCLICSPTTWAILASELAFWDWIQGTKKGTKWTVQNEVPGKNGESIAYWLWQNTRVVRSVDRLTVDFHQPSASFPIVCWFQQLADSADPCCPLTHTEYPRKGQGLPATENHFLVNLKMFLCYLLAAQNTLRKAGFGTNFLPYRKSKKLHDMSRYRSLYWCNSDLNWPSSIPRALHIQTWFRPPPLVYAWLGENTGRCVAQIA